MAHFNLSITRPKTFLHSDAFRDVADSLAWSLVTLGHSATIRDNWLSTEEGDTNILFGAELLSPGQVLPPNTVIYNLEQSTHPMMPKVQALARGLRVWDYSLRNVKEWQRLGYNCRHVPIGYTPNLTRVPQNVKRDIDCLFLGWSTPRRQKILDELTARGLKVVSSDRCYGGGRDALIARSKVVLNIHHDGRDMFEIVRISYLLANRKVVISESSTDAAEYRDLDDAYVSCRYSALVEECIFWNTYLELHPEEMDCSKSQIIFAGRDYTETVYQALTMSDSAELVALRYENACKEDGDMKDFLPWMKDHAKGTVLEIGVRGGHSTAALLAGVQKNGGTVLSVDLTDCSALYRNHPQWKFIQTSSQNPKLKVPPLDFVLIDGDHTREGYRRDLERFWPLVKPGGVILSHDISPEPGKSLEESPGEIVSICALSDGTTLEFHDNLPSKGIGEEFKKFCAEHEHELTSEVLPGKFGMGVITKRPVLDSDESWTGSEAALRA
jgi:predicted O-methyltransferase YrrM